MYMYSYFKITTSLPGAERQQAGVVSTRDVPVHPQRHKLLCAGKPSARHSVRGGRGSAASAEFKERILSRKAHCLPNTETCW